MIFLIAFSLISSIAAAPYRPFVYYDYSHQYYADPQVVSLGGGSSSKAGEAEAEIKTEGSKGEATEVLGEEITVSIGSEVAGPGDEVGDTGKEEDAVEAEEKEGGVVEGKGGEEKGDVSEGGGEGKEVESGGKGEEKGAESGGEGGEKGAVSGGEGEGKSAVSGGKGEEKEAISGGKDEGEVAVSESKGEEKEVSGGKGEEKEGNEITFEESESEGEGNKGVSESTGEETEEKSSGSAGEVIVEKLPAPEVIIEKESEGGWKSGCDSGEVRQGDGSCVSPLIFKKYFIFRPPKIPPPRVIKPVVPKPKQFYNVVFVQMPKKHPLPKPIVSVPPLLKTLIYVLNKHKDTVHQKLIQYPKSHVPKPKVNYITYDGYENPILPGGLSLNKALSMAASQEGTNLINLPQAEVDDSPPQSYIQPLQTTPSKFPRPQLALPVEKEEGPIDNTVGSDEYLDTSIYLKGFVGAPLATTEKIRDEYKPQW